MTTPDPMWIVSVQESYKVFTYNTLHIYRTLHCFHSVWPKTPCIYIWSLFCNFRIHASKL